MASLVGDLVEFGLVEEREPGPLGVAGRPSPVVGIRSDVVAIAIHPEIDALTIAVVGLDGHVRRVIRQSYDRIPTAGEVISVSAAVLDGMRVELSGLRTVGIGVAVPGQVRTGDGMVRNAPHLGWHDEPLGEPLADATGFPVRVANDAALGAIAEHQFGAGRGSDHLIYLNGGASGIGGGVISAGIPLGGASGYAGELGHIRVSSSSAIDSARIAGTLEAEVTRAELLESLGLSRAEPGQFEDTLLANRSARVGSVVERQLEHLASALAAAINVFNPQVIVLGGFLAVLQAYDPEHLRRAVAASTLPPALESVRITAAELGADLLMVGAAGLAFEPLLLDPALVTR